jgi:hypothetical protein
MSDLRSAMRVKADVAPRSWRLPSWHIASVNAARRQYLRARNRLHLRRDGERRTGPGKRVRMAAPTALTPTRIRVSVMSIGVMQAFGNQWPAKQARYAP